MKKYLNIVLACICILIGIYVFPSGDVIDTKYICAITFSEGSAYTIVQIYLVNGEHISLRYKDKEAAKKSINEIIKIMDREDKLL